MAANGRTKGEVDGSDCRVWRQQKQVEAAVDSKSVCAAAVCRRWQRLWP